MDGGMESKMLEPKITCRRESQMVDTKVTHQRNGNQNSEKPAQKYDFLPNVFTVSMIY